MFLEKKRLLISYLYEINGVNEMKILFGIFILNFPLFALCQGLPHPNNAFPELQIFTSRENNSILSPYTSSQNIIINPFIHLTSSLTARRAETQILLAYADGSAGTMTRSGQMADGRVQQTTRNAANSVSGLNANAEATAPVNTTGTVGTTGKTYAGQVPAQYFPQIGKILVASPQFSVGDNLGYNILDNRQILLGGHRYGDHSPTAIFATPYGGSGLGVTLSVVMQQKGIGGLQPAMAPSGTNGSGGISGYPEMDAAAVWSWVGSNEPWVKAGADITGEDSRAHAVTYDPTHAYFLPALPASAVARLRVGMHVMTNSIGSTRINTAHYWQPNNDYAGEITGISQDGTSITVGGWRVLGAGNTDPEQVPSTDASVIDTTTWPQYTHPALFMGVYTHAINYNPQCMLRAHAKPSGGDANNPMGLDGDMPVNDCEIEEADISTNMPDYMGRAKGILVTFNGPNKPSLDSYDFMASGTIPNGYVAWNGTQANNFISDGFYAHGPNGVNSGTDATTGNVTGAAGDTREMSEFIGHSAVQPNGSGSGDKISLAAWEALIKATGNMGANPASNTQVHWGYVVNGTDTDVSKLKGGEKINTAQVLGEVVYNVDGTGGVGVYGGAAGKGIVVDGSGRLKLSTPTYIAQGSTLFFSIPDNIFGTYLNIDASGNIVWGTQVTGGGNMSIPGQLTIGAVTYGNLGSTAVVGSQRYCTDCYSTNGTGHKKNIPVWWNGSAWTDALGDAVGH